MEIGAAARSPRSLSATAVIRVWGTTALWARKLVGD
jgi:hypothetical protein